jgi:hypothetical protein
MLDVSWILIWLGARCNWYHITKVEIDLGELRRWERIVWYWSGY